MSVRTRDFWRQCLSVNELAAPRPSAYKTRIHFRTPGGGFLGTLAGHAWIDSVLPPRSEALYLCRCFRTPSWFSLMYDYPKLSDMQFTCKNINFEIGRQHDVLFTWCKVVLDLGLFDREFGRRVATFCARTPLPAVLNQLVFSFVVIRSTRFSYE